MMKLAKRLQPLLFTLLILIAIGGVVMPARAIDAATPRANSVAERCFVESGSCLRGRFLDHWEANGGLARNGYPLADERREILEDGREYTVQYLERVRLEYHPENAPPYDVLLGPFGRRVLRDQIGGAHNARALFAEAIAPVAPRAGATHFPATGHNLGGRFADYWRANGGLAQFGFPITEERQERLETGATFTVQYFERGRLEPHPENPAPYDILIGQFGRLMLRDASYLRGDFGLLYLQQRALRDHLGTPLGPPSEMAGSTLTFERGRMVWLGEQKTDYWGGTVPTIYILLAGPRGSGQIYTFKGLYKTLGWPDSWQEGEAVGGGVGPREGLYLPRRGFGKVWTLGSGLREPGLPPETDVQEHLGYALAAEETGYRISVQRFQSGYLLSAPDGRFIDALITDDLDDRLYQRYPTPAR